MERNITEADIDLILDNLEWDQRKGTVEFDSLDNNDITFYIKGDHSHTHGYFARLLSDTALKLGYTASKIKEREIGSSYGDWYSSLTTFRIKKRLNKDRYVVLKQDLIDGSFYYYVYDVLESKTVRKPNSNQNNINDYYVFETKPEADKIAKMLNKNISDDLKKTYLSENLFTEALATWDDFYNLFSKNGYSVRASRDGDMDIYLKSGEDEGRRAKDFEKAKDLCAQYDLEYSEHIGGKYTKPYLIIKGI